MPKFGVYYIPPDGEFYGLGSSIVGYDIRAQVEAGPPPDLFDRVGGFEPDWVSKARPYGFHLTIGDAIEFEGDIDVVQREVESVLRCFHTNTIFALERRVKAVSTWGPSKEIVVLRYEANEALRMFHALIVGLVNPLGTGSGAKRHYDRDPTKYGAKPHRAERLQRFYAENVLDAYSAHFTLLNPYTGRDPGGLASALSREFRRFPVISVDSVCLVVQERDDQPWRVHREFVRAACVAPPTAARRLPRGTPGRDLLHLAGTLPPEDAEEMRQAIENGCEKVNPHGW